MFTLPQTGSVSHSDKRRKEIPTPYDPSQKAMFIINNLRL